MRHPWSGLQFALERFIVRGAFYRLLVVAAIIAAIAVVGGLIVFAAGEITNLWSAIWWAFLRLTDPGYLGDDNGPLKRIVSTIITVLGYVVFLGALVAIMTQWFHATMRRIEGGTTPISMRNHFVILGWTNRSAAIVRELVESENRVRRFFEKRGARDRLRVVILTEDPIEEVRAELRQILGARYTPDDIVVRAGSPLESEHLDRVDFGHSAAVILPADPTDAELIANIDAVTIKALLSTATSAREFLTDGDALPLVVAELSDDRKVRLAQSAYGGALETLATDRIIARLIAQNIRHCGLSRVYDELIGHSYGNEVYVRDWRGAPTTFRTVAGSFPHALPIGLVCGEPGAYQTVLSPTLDQPVSTHDKVVLISPDYASTAVAFDAGDFEKLTVVPENVAREMPEHRRILVLGWNRKIPVLLEELDRYASERFRVDNVSQVPADERRVALDRRIRELRHVEARFLEAELTSENDLAELDLPGYDVVVIAASDWLDDDAISDARSILGLLVVLEILSRSERRPEIVVELIDPDNKALLHGRGSDVIVSPVIISHMLTHIALRRELGAVFEELFGPHGAEIFFVPPDHYQCTGKLTFTDIRRTVAARGSVALGIVQSGEVLLNPEREVAFEAFDIEQIVVLSTY